MVQQLHYDGHEIGTYSLRYEQSKEDMKTDFTFMEQLKNHNFFSSHRKNFETLNYEEWVEEEIGMREILKARI